jgi:hypothetical protein
VEHPAGINNQQALPIRIDAQMQARLTAILFTAEMVKTRSGRAVPALLTRLTYTEESRSKFG